MLGSPLVIFMKFKSEHHAMTVKDPSFVSNFVFSPVNIVVSIFVFLVGLAIAAIFGSEKLRARFTGDRTDNTGVKAAPPQGYGGKKKKRSK